MPPRTLMLSATVGLFHDLALHSQHICPIVARVGMAVFGRITHPVVVSVKIDTPGVSIPCLT